MDKETRNLLIGLVLGGLIALTGSWVMWNIQIGYENANLAHGIYLDIDKSNASLQTFANVYKHPENLPIKNTYIVPSTSFYLDYRLSPTPVDISRFDPELSDKLYFYYYNLAEAETIRLHLNDPNSIESKNPYVYDTFYAQMGKDIINCSEEIQPIKNIIIKKYPNKPYFFF